MSVHDQNGADLLCVTCCTRSPVGPLAGGTAPTPGCTAHVRFLDVLGWCIARSTVLRADRMRGRGDVWCGGPHLKHADVQVHAGGGTQRWAHGQVRVGRLPRRRATAAGARRHRLDRPARHGRARQKQ